jgi:cytochrome c-type biogenesis protein CcmH
MKHLRLWFLLTASLVGLLLVFSGQTPVLASAPAPTGQDPAPQSPQAPVPTAAPVGSVSDDQVNAVAKQLYCPVCENIPLDVCPTQACAQWRELIREKLATGWNADQIKNYFMIQYGDRVLAQPPARGLNLLVYILPPVSLLLGVYILYRVFRSMRVRPGKTAPPVAPMGEAVPEVGPQDKYAKKMEEEMRQRF